MNVGAACSFSECAVTFGGIDVEDQRMRFVDGVLGGADAPAAVQAWRRAVARARSIAASAVSASTANTLIRRETVGSEATAPKISG
ncbi:hypothetical protein AK37_10561 [Rhodococcus pyridinivorans AK37]|uniref:Uncharacterized protein n=1 Tax=Rhodococcus pyridinivorans AK37 TaxID=1114960 RepID=H0JR26_9NOCA|nr:hypothetical protein AK37_10561 [Rhodococcus pyridinivorans AK37]